MITRSNKVFEEVVAKSLELSHQGDYFGAFNLLKENGIPSKIIARVLCQQNQRSTDSEKYSNSVTPLEHSKRH